MTNSSIHTGYDAPAKDLNRPGGPRPHLKLAPEVASDTATRAAILPR